MNSNYNIRKINNDELPLIFEWAKEEGWNPSDINMNCYYKIDSEGFLIGTLDNIPISTICAVRYGESFGFIGLFIVRPVYRQQGYGKIIWNKAISILKGRSIGLDSSIEQEEFYKKSGFKTAYKNICYEGIFEEPSKFSSPYILNLKNYSPTKLFQYDRNFFPENRNVFTDCLINNFNNISIGHHDYNNELNGYTILQPSTEGYKIAPLFAENLGIASVLMNYIKKRVSKKGKFYINIPDSNPYYKDLAETFNLKPISESIRMYKGTKPKLPIEKIYGITSLEVG